MDRIGPSRHVRGGQSATTGEMPIATQGITKYYGNLAANRDVSVTIEPGRVHALVGENGAGKSTLAKIIAGAIRPSEGEILIGDSPVKLASTRDALARGVGMIPQHPALIPEMTVVDNCLFGYRSSTGWVLSRDETRQELEQIGRPLGFEIALDLPVAKLSLGERQRAEIMRLLRRRARTLILDEPTDVLSPRETELLFASLRVIVADGATVILITHRLSEVFATADDVTVLRDGRVAGSGQICNLDESSLIEWMLGREYSAPAQRRSNARSEVALRLKGVSSGGRVPFSNASFAVAGGEVVGIAGVDGNGQEELAGVIAGTLAARSGTIELNGTDVTRLGASRRNTHGLGYIPADRQREGLVLGMTVAENLGLRGFQRGGPSNRGRIVSMPALRSEAERLVERNGIKCSSVDAPLASLSGGNQQKVILAREIARRPRTLIAAQPTRGLDIAARDAVHIELQDLAADGCGVLLLSSDLDEILRLSDRILVLERGRILTEFRGPQYDVAEIGRAMAVSGPVGPSSDDASDSTARIATSL
jgi:general nucleoside transport system ATP-binding protein